MRIFLDTEHDGIVTETELAAEFQPSEDFPCFENWLREIAGKNGTLTEVFRVGYSNMYHDVDGNRYIVK